MVNRPDKAWDAHGRILALAEEALIDYYELVDTVPPGHPELLAAQARHMALLEAADECEMDSRKWLVWYRDQWTSPK